MILARKKSFCFAENSRFSQHKPMVCLVELEMEADSVAKPEGLGILDGPQKVRKDRNEK